MVSSYLQLIERRYEEGLELAVDGADRMRAMIDGLLKYSRVETETDPLEAVDLESVFEDVCQDLQTTIEATDTTITAEPLPRVEGDPHQLRQVFQNLLRNAIQYSGPDSPTVSVATQRDGADWIVTVRDEGIGVDPEGQDRIFDIFERVHSRHESAGTGIGLALCQRILERHDGEIWVDSELGNGSAFSFRLSAVDETSESAIHR